MSVKVKFHYYAGLDETKLLKKEIAFDIIGTGTVLPRRICLRHRLLANRYLQKEVKGGR